MERLLKKTSHSSTSVVFFLKSEDSVAQQPHSLRPDLFIEVKHTYINRCKLLKPLIPIYQTVTVLWLIFFGIFYLHTYIYNKANILPLQRVIIIVPFIKIAETLTEGIYV